MNKQITFLGGKPTAKALNPLLTIYHSDQWLSMLSDYYGYQPRLITIEKNNEVLAAATMVEINNFTGKKLKSTPASMYNYLLATDETHLNELVSKIQSAAEADSRHLAFSSLNEIDGQCYLDQFEYDSVIPLVEKDTNWNALDSSARRAVRKCEKNGIAIKDLAGEGLNAFHTLYLYTRKRLGLPAAPYAWFQKIVDADIGRIILATKNNIPVAGILYLQDQDRLHYAVPGYSDEAMTLRALDGCVWHLIELGLAQNHASVCLGGSQPNNEGLRRFKKKWGAEEKEIWHYTNRKAAGKKKQSNNIGVIKYKLIQHMPNFLYKRLGHFYLKHLA